MYQSKQAFSLLELIFVILVIFIISTIAFIKTTSSNQNIISCKNDYYLINKAIKEKLHENTFKNTNLKIKQLEDTDILFSNILNNFNSSSWKKISSNKYIYKLSEDKSLEFIYSNNIFTCNKSNELCKKVLN